MFTKEFKIQLFNKWLALTGFEKTAKIQNVDFSKPWWKVLTDQKWIVLIALICHTISETFYVL
jgi:hypothetical protein